MAASQKPLPTHDLQHSEVGNMSNVQLNRQHFNYNHSKGTDPKESRQNIHNLSKSTTADRHDALLLHSQWHMKLRGGWNKTESHIPGKTEVLCVISGYVFIILMGSWKSLWLISEAVVIIKSMLCEQAYPLKSKSSAHKIKDFVQHWIWILCLLKNDDALDLWVVFLWLDDCIVWGRPPCLKWTIHLLPKGVLTGNSLVMFGAWMVSAQVSPYSGEGTIIVLA